MTDESSDEDKRRLAFLKWFIAACVRTNIDKSQEEELARYHNRAPYHERFCKWVNDFYVPNKDTDFGNDHNV